MNGKTSAKSGVGARASGERGKAPADHAVSSYIGSIVHNQFVTWLRKRGSQPTKSIEAGDRLSEIGVGGAAGAAECRSRFVMTDGRKTGSRPTRAQPPTASVAEPAVAHYVEGCTIDALAPSTGRRARR